MASGSVMFCLPGPRNSGKQADGLAERGFELEPISRRLSREAKF
jgi:hypothetical protein